MKFSVARLAVLGALLLASPCLAASGSETKGRAAAPFTITYVTSSTAYLDAGSDAGLRIGDVFEVTRDGAVVATLQVEAISSKRASCRRIDPSIPIEVGMKARSTRDPALSPLTTPPFPSSTEVPPPTELTQGVANRLRGLGLRGRVGVRYVGIRDRGDIAQDLNQPGFDLRVDGRSVAGSGFGVSADLRAQRTIRTVGQEDGVSKDRTRVYRLSGDWHAESRPVRVAVGRQLSLSIASIGVFDGASADFTTRRWTFGALAGTQPDPSTFGYSSRILEGGGFAELRGADRATTRWKVALGAVTSRNEGEVHRDYAALQASAYSPRVQLTWLQEIDWNRGWRREAEGRVLDVTSTFVSARAPLGARFAANAGYDNRRTVRLFRDEITPETDFDDRYRQGVWGGVDARVSAAGRVGVSVHHHAGGSSGEARSATVNGSLRGGGASEASVHARSTRYEGVAENGWLHSAGAGVSPIRRLHVDVTGGLRTTNPSAALAENTRETWVSLDLECPLTNPIYLLLSTEQSWDDDGGASLQIFGSAVMRF